MASVSFVSSFGQMSGQNVKPKYKRSHWPLRSELFTLLPLGSTSINGPPSAGRPTGCSGLISASTSSVNVTRQKGAGRKHGLALRHLSVSFSALPLRIRHTREWLRRLPQRCPVRPNQWATRKGAVSPKRPREYSRDTCNTARRAHTPRLMFSGSPVHSSFSSVGLGRGAVGPKRNGAPCPVRNARDTGIAETVGIVVRTHGRRAAGQQRSSDDDALLSMLPVDRHARCIHGTMHNASG